MPTKKTTVTQVLQEYIRHRKQARILKLFGTVEFDPKYDYKKQRRLDSQSAGARASKARTPTT